MKHIDIVSLYSDPAYIGQTVTVCGWVRTSRDSKNVAFLELNDGTSLKHLQIVLDKAVIADMSPFMPLGTSLKVEGELVQSERNGVEVNASTVEVLGVCPGEYPLQKKRCTLEFLRKGGRIGLVEGVVGSLLQIKPVIYVNDDGVYATLVKARGFAKALNAMQEEFFKRYQGRKVRVAIVHGAAFEEAKALLETFRQKLDVVSDLIAPVSPALAIHTGPGLLGAIVQYAD